MNDALLGTWIKLTNAFVALTLTGIQSQSLGFQTNLEHLVTPDEPLSGTGLAMRIPAFFFGVHLVLAMVIFVHVCVNKFKDRNSTPVIHIYIPNPGASLDQNENQHQHSIAINNQPYNNDLFDFTCYFVLVLINAIFFIPFLYEFKMLMADYFDWPESDFLIIFTLVRNFVHTFVLAFLSPLVLMIVSDELRPFLMSFLSCSCNNNNMIEVYT